MEKHAFAALFALPLLAAGTLYAEEFDVEYRADSLKLPDAVGFRRSYQIKEPEEPGFCGVAPNSDGVTVLHLDNRGTGPSEFPKFFYVFKSDLRQITIDFKVRITDPESKTWQFQVSAVLPDPSRERNRLALVAISRDRIRTNMGDGVPYRIGKKFHSFRLLLDVESNRFELYDLDSGKLVIGGKAMNADPKGVVNSFMFGDGSSTVRGVAEVVEVRAAANKLLRPTGKR